ncbi:hypothetical protein KC614_00910 [candidate division WWE3 bacterium]|uniref:Uncharacterized protein n=1 Tax=candidate division WWE3 bacterium TaxID=2053526 RepID=A0A955RRP7_UNCKA|nr:hypothetical protein [candidate division WWE3 bacterium]
MASTPTTGGTVLGASILPATTAAGFVAAKLGNAAVIAAFIALNAVILVWQVGSMLRFAVNKRRGVA